MLFFLNELPLFFHIRQCDIKYDKDHFWKKNIGEIKYNKLARHSCSDLGSILAFWLKIFFLLLVIISNFFLIRKMYFPSEVYKLELWIFFQLNFPFFRWNYFCSYISLILLKKYFKDCTLKQKHLKKQK